MEKSPLSNSGLPCPALCTRLQEDCVNSAHLSLQHPPLLPTFSHHPRQLLSQSHPGNSTEGISASRCPDAVGESIQVAPEYSSTTHRAQLTTHITQLTAHRSQLHRTQVITHITQLTTHTTQVTTHTTQFTTHTAQLTTYNAQLHKAGSMRPLDRLLSLTKASSTLEIMREPRFGKDRFVRTE